MYIYIYSAQQLFEVRRGLLSQSPAGSWERPALHFTFYIAHCPGILYVRMTVTVADQTKTKRQTISRYYTIRDSRRSAPTSYVTK
jgi:hypothetical protein